VNRKQILKSIKELSKSQGFYGRLYNSLMKLQLENKEAFDRQMELYEKQNFKDTTDMVLFFES